MTFNGKDAPAEAQALAVSQCDAQLMDPEMQKGKKTKCEVSFSKNTTIEQTGIIRAVFRCVVLSGGTFDGKIPPSANKWVDEDEDAPLIGKYRGRV